MTMNYILGLRLDVWEILCMIGVFCHSCGYKLFLKQEEPKINFKK